MFVFMCVCICVCICVGVHEHIHIKLFICFIDCMYRFLTRSTFWWKWMICDQRIMQGDPLCVMSTVLVFSLCSGVWRMVYTSHPLPVFILSVLNCLSGTFLWNEIYQIRYLDLLSLSLFMPQALLKHFGTQDKYKWRPRFHIFNTWKL